MVSFKKLSLIVLIPLLFTASEYGMEKGTTDESGPWFIKVNKEFLVKDVPKRAAWLAYEHPYVVSAMFFSCMPRKRLEKAGLTTGSRVLTACVLSGIAVNMVGLLCHKR